MTTVELFHRIGRRARTGDFTKLSMSEQTDIQEAANAGLEEAYNLLPTYFKEITEGFLLPAPLAITAGVTQYSNQLSGEIFSPEQFGRSVVLDGDANWNQVLSGNTLLNPYMGTTGTVGGTVYGDAVYSQRYPFERIIGNPSFPNQGQTVLLNQNMQNSGNAGPGWFWQQTSGLPQYWWTQTLGQSQGNEPLLVLRFSPAPDQAYAISVRLSFWPKQLTLSDYEAATRIVVPDQFLVNGLIPLAIQQLSSMPLWAGGDAGRVDEAAERARAFLRNQVGQVSAPNNQVFTPIGF